MYFVYLFKYIESFIYGFWKEKKYLFTKTLCVFIFDIYVYV